ncbi:MAG TPA: PPC domain-containing DNA-binding protein [Oculatellaceae cyanobacterium]
MNNFEKIIAVRLRPKDDLKQALENITRENRVSAAAIASAVGSLASAAIRLGTGEVKNLEGPFEIVALCGTLGHGGMHVHIAVADGRGNTFGGHMLHGCEVNTTVEIVILNLSDSHVFDRVEDPDTGYRELVVTPVNQLV